MNERKLNFAEKPVQVLTLDELEKSYHENLPTGDPVGGRRPRRRYLSLRPDTAGAGIV